MCVMRQKTDKKTKVNTAQTFVLTLIEQCCPPLLKTKAVKPSELYKLIWI